MRASWPCELFFEGHGRSKSESRSEASSQLLRYLIDNGHVNKTMRPVLISKSEQKALSQQRVAPVDVRLPVDCIPIMNDLVTDFEVRHSQPETTFSTKCS